MNDTITCAHCGSAIASSLPNGQVRWQVAGRKFVASLPASIQCGAYVVKGSRWDTKTGKYVAIMGPCAAANEMEAVCERVGAA
jgi:hypothetical protein